MNEEELVDALRQHGLGLSSTPTFSASGVPATTIGIRDGIVVVGDGSRKITIETSTDLRTWAPLYSTAVPAGARMVVTEVVTGPSFYRVLAE